MHSFQGLNVHSYNSLDESEYAKQKGTKQAELQQILDILELKTNHILVVPQGVGHRPSNNS